MTVQVVFFRQVYFILKNYHLYFYAIEYSCTCVIKKLYARKIIKNKINTGCELHVLLLFGNLVDT